MEKAEGVEDVDNKAKSIMTTTRRRKQHSVAIFLLILPGDEEGKDRER